VAVEAREAREAVVAAPGRVSAARARPEAATRAGPSRVDVCGHGGDETREMGALCLHSG